MRILEVGCGTGRNLASSMKRGSVCAVDFDFDAVSTAHSLLAEEGMSGGAFFTVARAEALPFSEDIFDEIHCVDVLHWASGAEQFEAMWMESWRVLRPGGIFFATLRTGPPDARWFFADQTLIETLAGTCKGEWIHQSEFSLALQKRS